MGLHEAALEALPVPVIVHDLEFVIYANAAACAAFRATDRTQIEGHLITDFVHEDGLDAGRERRRLILEEGHGFSNVLVKALAVDGTAVYFTGSGIRIVYNGRPAILICEGPAPRP